MGRFTHAASLMSAAASPGRSRSESRRVEPGAGVRGGMLSGVARFEPSNAQAVRAGGTDTYRLAPAAVSPIVISLTRNAGTLRSGRLSRRPWTDYNYVVRSCTITGSKHSHTR
jgi:hypothetical protein